MTNVFPAPEPDEPTEPVEYTPEQIKGASFVTTVWMVGLIIICLFVVGLVVYKICDAIGLIPWS